MGAWWFATNGKKRGVGVDVGVERLRQFPLPKASVRFAEVEKIVEGIEQEAEKRWPMVNQMYVRPMSGAASLRLGPLADGGD